MNSKLWKIPLLLTMPLALVACDDDDDDDSGPVLPEGSSFVRVTHASPDAPNVDVYVDGAKALENVPWQFSSGLVELTPGEHEIRVVALTAGGEVEVFNANLDLMEGVEYNAYAIGNVADGIQTGMALGEELPAGFNIALVARDDVDVAADMVRVQVLHGSQGVPAVDVHVTGADDELSDGTVLDTLAFGQYTDVVEVPAGTYRVRLTVDGDDTFTAAYDITTDLPGGADIVVTAIPNVGAGDSPVDLLLQDGATDEAGNDALVVASAGTGSDVRITHTIADVGGVDVWLNGAEPAVDGPLYNLTFPNTTPDSTGGYLAVPADSYDIDVALTGTTNIAISAMGVELVPSATYSVLAIGEGDGDPAPALWAVADDPRAIATDARLRLFHASPAAGPVNIILDPMDEDDMDAEMIARAGHLDEDAIAIEGVPYETDSGYLNLAPGKYALWFTPADDASVIALGPLVLDLAAGMTYTGIAVNDPMNDTGVAKEGIGVGLIGLDDFMPVLPMPQVNVLHASPDAPNVNVLVDGEVALANVAYKQASGGISLPEGTYDFQIDALNPDGSLLATVLPATEVTLTGGTNYTVSAIGYAAELGTESETAFQPSIVTAPYAVLHDVRVQVQHSAPNAPEVDIHVSAPDAELSADTVLATLAFGDYTMPVTVPEGDYRVRITLPGQFDAVYDSGTLSLTESDLFIAAVENTGSGDELVQLLVMDGVAEDGNDAVMLLDQNAGTDIRVVHTVANPAAALVDVWVNLDVALEDFAFTDATGFIGLPAAETDFYVTAPDASYTEALISLEDAQLMAGDSLTVLAIGGSNDEDLELWPIPAERRSIFSQTYLQLVHAATGAPGVDIYLSADDTLDAGDALLAEDLEYGQWAALWSGAPVAGFAFVAVADSLTVAIGPLPIAAEAGKNYSVVAIDDGEGGFSAIDLDGIVPAP